MRIDAHQHYWSIARGDYGWITPEIPKLYRDFLPADLEPHLRVHGLDGTILVQAAPTVSETDFILRLAEQTPSILGVVGWLDLFDPNHRLHYERFSRHPKFAGFRIMIQDMPDAARILEPVFVKALKGYAGDDVPIDLLIVSGQLPPVLELLRQVPNLRGVIDHIGKPSIRSHEWESWTEAMSQAAAFPGIHCKISGMVTEADHESWNYEEFAPYVQHILETFGPDRVMFGSDWPVCLLAAGYDEVIEIVRRALPKSWGEEEQSRLFGVNAKEFYKL
ncbi:amidohydrolase family protein [Paenibacillus lautus]|uniref:amidohydrolase family protein n=1 Tax=Paenibacillus lautus TaxID=1401 RepID=UPI001C7D7F0F|nr:amidohydrolase family protein [Paenibacillus lautus]MBX4146773.1 amidohydrolase family protein [Paenibacillus lautus]